MPKTVPKAMSKAMPKAVSSDVHVLAERTVPRYTSYPTAPNFIATIGPEQYAAWLSDLSPATALSIYLHVPFCTELCLYCGCHTKAIRQRAPLERYVRQLTDEISLVASRTGRRNISHLHWGGGTPSILGPDQMLGLVEHLDRSFVFSAIREHAIELDPRLVSKPLVRTLKAMGVTRASLGVQDFSDHVQKAIGRIQPYELVCRAVDTLRDGGIDSINFDLMYGLPHQSADDVRRTATSAVLLKPQRIAFFGYAHVPWFKSQQRLIDTEALPGSHERLNQMDAARETFVASGYQPVGLDHFAQPDDELAIAARSGRLHRNFQGYTTDDAGALIGFGASAIGRLPQGFVQNAPDMGTYSRAITSGRLATVKGIQLSADDRQRSRIIEALMCDLRVNLDTIVEGAAPQNRGMFQPEIEALAPLENEGIVQLDGNSIIVTDKGRSFIRLVAAEFDPYFKNSSTRHSVAV